MLRFYLFLIPFPVLSAPSIFYGWCVTANAGALCCITASRTPILPVPPWLLSFLFLFSVGLPENTNVFYWARNLISHLNQFQSGYSHFPLPVTWLLQNWCCSPSIVFSGQEQCPARFASGKETGISMCLARLSTVQGDWLPSAKMSGMCWLPDFPPVKLLLYSITEFTMHKPDFLFSWIRPYLKQGGHFCERRTDHLCLPNICFLFAGFCFLLQENVSKSGSFCLIQFWWRVLFQSSTSSTRVRTPFLAQLHLLLLS